MTTEKVERTFQVGESFALNFNEIGILATSIKALGLLYDHHDVKTSEAEAMDGDASYHRKRMDEIRAEQHNLLLAYLRREHLFVIVRKDRDGDWLYLTSTGGWTSDPDDAYPYFSVNDTVKRAEKLRAQVLP